VQPTLSQELDKHYSKSISQSNLKPIAPIRRKRIVDTMSWWQDHSVLCMRCRTVRSLTCVVRNWNELARWAERQSNDG